ncbi:MAG: hypothetical protein MUE95_10150 [Cyclobacteriaceae bacterium]|nr:hypothetical protein [Cyclobacteriaceae bacterium]
MRKIICLLLYVMLTSIAHAQEEKSTQRGRDVIITTEGQVIQALVIEVNESEIKYQLADMGQMGPTFTIPVNKVYAINYDSGTTQYFTPRLNGKKVTALKTKPDTTWNYLIGNVSRGVLRIGLGSVKNFSTWNNMDDFSSRNVIPGFTAAYHFQVSRLLQAGSMLSIAEYEYRRTINSTYDNLIIDQRVNENLWALGFFARYELSQTFVRPYIIGGANLVFSNTTVTSDLTSNILIKSVRSEVPITSFRPAFIFRVGIDMRLSSRFGIYVDVGSGLHLVQNGFIFILED